MSSVYKRITSEEYSVTERDDVCFNNLLWDFRSSGFLRRVDW